MRPNSPVGGESSSAPAAVPRGESLWLAQPDGGAAPRLNDARLAEEVSMLELAVPSSGLHQLKLVSDRASMIRDALSRMRAAVDEQNRLAEVEIRCARLIGSILAGERHRGGRGSKYSRGTSNRGGSSSPLPDWISRNQSSRCQRLAALPDERFEQSLALLRNRGAVPTMAGVLRMASQPRRSPGTSSSQRHVDVCQRVASVMTIDLAVGVAMRLPNATSHASEFPRHPPRCVMVWAVGRERTWVPRLVRARRSGEVGEAAFAAAAHPGEPWFAQTAWDGWTFCFAGGDSRSALCVGYSGPRARDFAVVMSEIGVLVRVLR